MRGRSLAGTRRGRPFDWDNATRDECKMTRSTAGLDESTGREGGRFARITLTLGAFVTVLSCGGDDTAAPPPGPPPPPPTANVPARITIEPETVAVVIGDTVRVTARVLNDRAQPISDAVVTWASSDPAIASVDATGLVTGIREGRVTLTATSGPVNTSAPAAVHSLDRETLVDLLLDTSGESWTNRENWGSDEPIGTWYGVEANADARVTALRLSENGLSGQLPQDLGNLAFLTEIELHGNPDLAGPIPPSLADLDIRQLRYGGTMLCTIRDEDFQAWLNAVPTRDGEFLACNEERSDLMKLYEAMGGKSWTESTNWGTSAPLSEWYGIAVDSVTGRVVGIHMRDNNLSGTVPPELRFFPQLQTLRLDYNQLEGEVPAFIGELTELQRVDIDGNNFTGSIPPEFGDLVNLEVLWMGGNRMTGPIPPELGNLEKLIEIHLYNAAFEGTIPEEFSNLTALELLHISETRIEGGLPEGFEALTELRWIRLYENMLSEPLPTTLGQLPKLSSIWISDNMIEGPLPAELGQLDSLAFILAENNNLSGPLPPELGDASELYRVWLHGNPDLSGPLPESMTALTELWELRADGTGLCMPRTPAFQAWTDTVYFKHQIRRCGSEGWAEAYLTQTIQSRDFPVPLVAGESAILRVFVTSEEETTESIPPVRATFFLDGAEVHVAEIPAGSATIPTEVQEGELELSANVEIPAEVIQPGLEMVVEVDPGGTVDPELGVAKRIPAQGREEVDVRAVPPLHLTLVPFVSTVDNDRDAQVFVSAATADHEMFWQTRNLLPVGTFEVRKHASVTVDTNDIFEILADVGRLRLMEDGAGHWMGLIPDPAGAGGVAYLPFLADSLLHLGKTSVSQLDAETIAHELGHNLSLRHADCGEPAGIDLSFPHENGRTGVWGYDPRDGSLVPPDRVDLMSYCDPTWVSDYYFGNALRFRLQDRLEIQGARVPVRALLVSGGVAADGALHLDPAFVIDAPPAVPRASGPYALTGRRADGSELFSFSFGVPRLLDGDGRSGFAFALPVQAAWESELASLVLTGPGGLAEMRAGSEPPMAIMRDPVTGEVRAILRDLPAAAMGPGALDALAPEPGLDIVVSGGLPGAAAWRR